MNPCLYFCKGVCVCVWGGGGGGGGGGNDHVQIVCNFCIKGGGGGGGDIGLRGCWVCSNKNVF